MLDISVIVSTFGNDQWKALAERAIESAKAAGAAEVIYNHGSSLHEARNLGVAQANCDWVVHLDADDQLTPNFLDEISVGSADVRVPAICYSQTTRFNTTIARIPRVMGHGHACTPACLELGNYIIVGALVRRTLVLEVGGWRDYEALEDYDLWQRCWLAGATFENKSRAIYLAQSRANSRNRITRATMKQLHYKINSRNMPNKDWKWLLR